MEMLLILHYDSAMNHQSVSLISSSLFHIGQNGIYHEYFKRRALCYERLHRIFGTGYYTATVPLILFWLLIHFGTNYYFILSARVFSGITLGAVYLVLVLFSAEVANDNVRGSLTSLTMLSANIGSLIGFILGAFVEYHYIPYICITMPIIFIVIFISLPSTPRYYLSIGDIPKAEGALKFYKGYKGKDPLEDDAIADEFYRLKTLEYEQKTTEKLQISDFCNKRAIKGILIGIAMNAIATCSACYILLCYAPIIFAHTDSTMFSPYVSTILLSISLTFGSLLNTILADVLGRRTLVIISLAVCVVGLLAMALHYYFYLIGCDLSSFKWAPVFSLSFVIFIAAAGVLPLASVCSVENLPTKIRNVGLSIVAFAGYVTIFVALKIFPFLMDVLDLHGCMTLFAILSAAGIFFVVAFLKETCGQSLDIVDHDEHVESECPRAGGLSFGINKVAIQSQE